MLGITHFLKRQRWEREEVNTGFWWGNVWDTGHLEDLGVNGRIILK
jgi:hypothetical protein